MVAYITFDSLKNYLLNNTVQLRFFENWVIRISWFFDLFFWSLESASWETFLNYLNFSNFNFLNFHIAYTYK